MPRCGQELCEYGAAHSYTPAQQPCSLWHRGLRELPQRHHFYDLPDHQQEPADESRGGRKQQLRNLSLPRQHMGGDAGDRGCAWRTCNEMGRTWIGSPATKVRPVLKADGTAHVTGGECSTCHFNTTSFKGATDLPSNHIPLPVADNNCALCHTTVGNYSLAVMSHANLTRNGAQCRPYGP